MLSSTCVVLGLVAESGCPRAKRPRTQCRFIRNRRTSCCAGNKKHSTPSQATGCSLPSDLTANSRASALTKGVACPAVFRTCGILLRSDIFAVPEATHDLPDRCDPRPGVGTKARINVESGYHCFVSQGSCNRGPVCSSNPVSRGT